jgi:hypothetical protein
MCGREGKKLVVGKSGEPVLSLLLCFSSHPWIERKSWTYLTKGRQAVEQQKYTILCHHCAKLEKAKGRDECCYYIGEGIKTPPVLQ